MVHRSSVAARHKLPEVGAFGDVGGAQMSWGSFATFLEK